MLFYETIVMSVMAYSVLWGISAKFRMRSAVLAATVAFVGVYTQWGLLHFAHIGSRPLVTVLVGAWIFSVLLILAVGVPWLGALLIQRIRRRHSSTTAAAPSGSPTRRDFLATVALPSIGWVLGARCARRSSEQLLIVRKELTVRGWPPALDGFRIGQITDLHVGDFISPDWVASAVRILNAAGVHLQVMTGDLIDDIRLLEPTFSALQLCNAPYGMVSILGNHEKMRRRFSPVLSSYQRHAGSQVRLLIDATHVIEHQGTSLQIVGADYPMRINRSRPPNKVERDALMKKSAARAFATAKQGMATVCLSHHPDFFPLAAAHGAQVTLAGHTHGGQLFTKFNPLLGPYHYVLGHYQLGDAHLYVSGGTGHWLPLRYQVPMEVTIITLRAG